VNQGKLRWTKANLAEEEAYVSYNGTLYVPYIAVYIFHAYTGTLYVAYMNALPWSAMLDKLSTRPPLKFFLLGNSGFVQVRSGDNQNGGQTSCKKTKITWLKRLIPSTSLLRFIRSLILYASENSLVDMVVGWVIIYGLFLICLSPFISKFLELSFGFTPVRRSKNLWNSQMA